jgi:hypothetical protein
MNSTTTASAGPKVVPETDENQNEERTQSTGMDGTISAGVGPKATPKNDENRTQEHTESPGMGGTISARVEPKAAAPKTDENRSEEEETESTGTGGTISAGISPKAALRTDKNRIEEHTEITGIVGTIPPRVDLSTGPRYGSDTRGKLQVLISDEGFEAGRLNTVRIVRSNPFDVPVEILDIEAPRSSYLGTSLEEERRTVGRRPRDATEHPPDAAPQSRQPGFFRRLVHSIGSVSEISFGLPTFSGTSVKFAGPDASSFTLNAEEGSDIVLDQPMSKFTSIRINAEKNAKLKLSDATWQNIMAEQGGKELALATIGAPSSLSKNVIEPHCETVAYVPLITTGWMLFKPLRMNLTYLIRFTAGDNSRQVLTQVITSALDVRPPLRSIVIGSIFGSVLGASAKFAQLVGQSGTDAFSFLIDHTSVEITQIVASIIMGVIATVALSRKSGAQNFITVEDFFGGFVIGVLIGYQGTSYFENILGHLGPPQKS